VLNEIAEQMRCAPVADEFDGATAEAGPAACRDISNRRSDGEFAPAPAIGSTSGVSGLGDASFLTARIYFEYCFRTFGDALPVIPPTPERIARMARAARQRTGRKSFARVPPCYGEATVEKIAAKRR